MRRKPLVYGDEILEQLPAGDRLNLNTLNIGPVGPTLTIASNAITVTSNVHRVFSVASPLSARHIHTINGGHEGDVCLFMLGVGSQSIVFNDGAGNLLLNSNYTIAAGSIYSTIVLYFDGTLWIELCRSNNGA